ncbi:MAG TPA: sensor histidine kinase [Ruminococcaceae bacterium]|nr:sensor histidine kinase [Oscillospiraceae bacterium]
MPNKSSKINFRGGLTKRWLFQTSTIIVAVLLIICIAAAYFIHSYYYSTVERKIESYSKEIVDIYFENYASDDDAAFEKGAREYISDFTDKSSVEVWMIDKYGSVFISSSGFPVANKVKIPEYEDAMTNGRNNAVWHGTNESGEKIIALTKIITDTENKQVGSVRYMISLVEIDDQIRTWYFIISLVFLLLVLLLVISGTVFISSIVRPIQEVCDTAKMIADGNYDARIDHYLYKDEVGQLCDTINEMAEKIKTSDKIKNDFISTVSHELRTPLTAIKGWGETLLQIGDTDPNLTKRGMNVIISESSRLNGIVEELLDFSRMQSGRMVLKNEKMDILAELDETVFAFKDRAMREGIELVYNAPNLPAPMNGDPDRIKQVFVNILDNALKYTKQGGKIVVSTEIKDDKITIVISDTGCGISAEDLPHVKEKFYKTNMTVHGSGIGLAVVDEIVRLHHGTFDIDSVLGQGTSVTISFDIDHVELDDVWDIDAAIAAENEKKAMEENEDA